MYPWRTNCSPLRKYVPPTEVHQKWILKGLSVLSDKWALGIAQKHSLRVIFLSFSARVLFLCFRLLDPIRWQDPEAAVVCHSERTQLAVWPPHGGDQFSPKFDDANKWVKSGFHLIATAHSTYNDVIEMRHVKALRSERVNGKKNRCLPNLKPLSSKHLLKIDERWPRTPMSWFVAMGWRTVTQTWLPHTLGYHITAETKSRRRLTRAKAL